VKIEKLNSAPHLNSGVYFRTSSVYSFILRWYDYHTFWRQ